MLIRRCDCETELMIYFCIPYISFEAMVTGTVPGFIDVVMNFASTELKEDNIILKLHLMGKKINFFGDETWLKLFPNCFMRHDGTTSFVVSDYKEVCCN